LSFSILFLNVFQFVLNYLLTISVCWFLTLKISSSTF